MCELTDSYVVHSYVWCVAVCCSVFQCVAVWIDSCLCSPFTCVNSLHHTATHFNTLQHTHSYAVHSYVWQDVQKLVSNLSSPTLERDMTRRVHTRRVAIYCVAMKRTHSREHHSECTSCHTCEAVSRVKHTNESWQAHEWVVSDSWIIDTSDRKCQFCRRNRASHPTFPKQKYIYSKEPFLHRNRQLCRRKRVSHLILLKHTLFS